MSLPNIPGLFTALDLLQPYHSHSHRKTPAVEQGCLTAQSKDEPDHKKLLGEIKAFAGGRAEGWVCFAQKLIVGLGNDALPRDHGLLLSAEFAHQPVDGSDPKSLHVRHLGDKWLFTEITRVKAAEGFLVPHRFISSREASSGSKATLHLKYEVFWESPDPAKPFRATLSRFTGFDDKP